MLDHLHPDVAVRRPAFVDRLRQHGEARALVHDGDVTSYSDLAEQVEVAAAAIGDGRRLVMLAASPTPRFVVHYLAALHAGHVVILVDEAHPEAHELVRATYLPDTEIGAVRTNCHEPVHPARHDLHPDLAVLLSTSGSTGSPKLVRLSHTNLDSNADAIAAYLGLQPDDVGVTSLPLHYCYGLSVLHSHLAVGASVLLTPLSVVDPCFWEAAGSAGVTTLAGVPYTFDLLERSGAERLSLPSLRRVTQAGGRMAPDRVTALAEAGRRAGFDLFVMYGQTEATARMAYLPPHLALSHPSCVGVAIPGGQITIEPPLDDDVAAGLDDGVGELVYRGPNVMLGYARTAADLARGRTVEALRTGDLARLTPDGLVEVVGRAGRTAKLFGLRIDTAHLEHLLAGYGYRTAVAPDGDVLVIAVEQDADPDWVGRLAAEDARLPRHAVRAVAVERLPRVSSGKVDLSAVACLGRETAPEHPLEVVPSSSPDDVPHAAEVGRSADDVRALFAELLERPDATPDDTFVGLGGDSLSYVAASVELERVLGHLPQGWHVTPIRALRPRRRRWHGVRGVETGIIVRAVAVVLIVATHVGVLDAAGSAHVLLALAGYNFARFQLHGRERAERVRGQVRSILRIVVPSVVWIGAVTVLLDAPYGWRNLTLTNGLTGPASWDATWHFWFVEVLVWVLVGSAALSALPCFDRLERRAPLAVPLGVLAVGLLARFDLVVDLTHPKPVLWLFALGWTVARATTMLHRIGLSAIALATVPGFFDDPRRDGLILVGVLLVLWVPRLPVPSFLVPVAGTLAAASLYVYLTHWQVYPVVERVDPLLAVVAALAVGVAYMRASQAVSASVVRVVQRRRRQPAG